MPPKRNVFNKVNSFITNTEHGGPFNIVAETRPTEQRDANFWDHDQGYTELGDAAYTRWNKPDQELLEKLEKSGSNYDTLPRLYFQAKKQVAPDISMTGLRGTKRKRDHEDTPIPRSDLRFYYKPNAPGMSAPSAKYKYKGVATAHSLQRYVAKKYHSRGRVKGYRFKHPEAPTARALVQSMYPIVKWTMVGASFNHTSTAGKQAILANGADNAMLKKDALQNIYKKVFTDGMLAPQVNLNPTPSGHIIKNTDVTVRDNFKPSLQCLQYTRKYDFVNRGDTVAYLEFWECLSLDNQTDNFRQNWSNALTQSSATVDGTYGLQGLMQNTVNPTTEHQYDITDAGLEPFKNLKELWRNYKILRKTRFKLEPGAHASHYIRLPGFTISHSTLYDPDHTGKSWMKDISINVVYKLIGERCYDNASDGTGALSYMPTKVSIDYTDFMKYRMRPRLRKSFHFITNSHEFIHLPFVETNYNPVATKPTVAMPHGTQPVENQHDTLAQDDKVAGGAEMEIIDGQAAAVVGDLT